MSAVSVSVLNGFFKETYAKKINKVIPKIARILDLMPFVKDELIGNYFNQPVALKSEGGFTYAGPRAGVFDLDGARAMATENAKVDPYQIVLQSQMDLETAARAQTSKQAFVKATSLLMENMLESFYKRLIMSAVYGSTTTGLGELDSSVNTDTTHTVVTFTAASWIDTLWIGAEGHAFDAYNSSTSALINSNAALVVDSVNFDTRAVTFSGNSTDIAALDTRLASGNAYAFYYGAYGNEMSGVESIISNTGTKFNISAADYGLWKGSTKDVGGPLSIESLLKYIGIPFRRGLEEDAFCLCHGDVWAELNSGLQSNARYQGNYEVKTGKAGFRQIEYYAASGVVEIIPTSAVKRSEAFIVPKSKIKRLGTTDITFNVPGKDEDEFFIQLEGKAGVEYRAYTGQAVFIETPARCLKLYGITTSL